MSDQPPVRVTIHQPNLFPRLKVLQKIARGDAWVILDDVQYVIREWQNRARLRCLNRPEQEFWLTIPVHRPEGQMSIISNVHIYNSQHVLERLYKTIKYTYRNSKYWGWIDAYANRIFDGIEENLANFCTKSTYEIFNSLDINKSPIFSSDLQIEGKGTTKLVNICKRLGSKVYISGSGGKTYLKEDEFRAEGIIVEWQNWTPPVLGHDLETLSWRNISFLDLLARCGPENLRSHLISWNQEIINDVV